MTKLYLHINFVQLNLKQVICSRLNLKKMWDSNRCSIEPSTNALKHRVWSLRTSTKIKHFLWRAISGILPTRHNLVERHCGFDRACPRCGAASETVNHLLFESPAAVRVWERSPIPSIPGFFPSEAIFTNFDHLLWRAKESNVQEKALASFPWMLWFLWKARNEKVFNNKDVPPKDTVQIAISETEAWYVAQLVAKPQKDSATERISENRVGS